MGLTYCAFQSACIMSGVVLVGGMQPVAGALWYITRQGRNLQQLGVCHFAGGPRPFGHGVRYFRIRTLARKRPPVREPTTFLVALQKWAVLSVACCRSPTRPDAPFPGPPCPIPWAGKPSGVVVAWNRPWSSAEDSNPAGVCVCVCEAQFFQIVLKLRGSTMMRPNHEFWCVCVCVCVCARARACAPPNDF